MTVYRPAQMTDKAIQLLSKNEKGFLEVEGALIDKEDHAANLVAIWRDGRSRLSRTTGAGIR
ncbi:alkaline phosphatase [Shigella flexneri]